MGQCVIINVEAPALADAYSAPGIAGQPCQASGQLPMNVESGVIEATTIGEQTVSSPATQLGLGDWVEMDGLAVCAP